MTRTLARWLAATAWLCREGLVRFATVPYAAPTKENMSQNFMHLTNYSLNKDSSGYEEGEHKRPLSDVLKELATEGIDEAEVRGRSWGGQQGPSSRRA